MVRVSERPLLTERSGSLRAARREPIDAGLTGAAMLLAVHRRAGNAAACGLAQHMTTARPVLQRVTVGEAFGSPKKAEVKFQDQSLKYREVPAGHGVWWVMIDVGGGTHVSVFPPSLKVAPGPRDDRQRPTVAAFEFDEVHVTIDGKHVFFDYVERTKTFEFKAQSSYLGGLSAGDESPSSTLHAACWLVWPPKAARSRRSSRPRPLRSPTAS